MSTHAFVGRADGAHTILVRYIHFDGVPNHIVPTLRSIWAGTFNRDTTVLIDTVLSHDWASLDAAVTPGPRDPFGDTPIAGVGTAMDLDDTTAPTPAHIDQLHALGARWIYLIDPATDTITLHTCATGREPLGHHRLAP